MIEFAVDELRKLDQLEIVAEPQLTITAFRHRDGDAKTRELLGRINAKKRVMLTPATVNGMFVIRIAIVSHRTHRDRVEMMLDDIREAV